MLLKVKLTSWLRVKTDQDKQIFDTLCDSKMIKF